MIDAALRAIAGHDGGADFGRQVEHVGATALGMIGEHQLEQRIPIGIIGDGRNSTGAPRSLRSPRSAIWMVTNRSLKSSSARRARNASGVKQSVWITRHGVWPRWWSIAANTTSISASVRAVTWSAWFESRHLRLRGIGNDVAMRRRDHRDAEPALPAIRLGDAAREVSCHERRDACSAPAAVRRPPPRAASRRAASSGRPIQSGSIR